MADELKTIFVVFFEVGDACGPIHSSFAGATTHEEWAVSAVDRGNKEPLEHYCGYYHEARLLDDPEIFPEAREQKEVKP